MVLVFGELTASPRPVEAPVQPGLLIKAQSRREDLRWIRPAYPISLLETASVEEQLSGNSGTKRGDEKRRGHGHKLIYVGILYLLENLIKI